MKEKSKFAFRCVVPALAFCLCLHAQFADAQVTIVNGRGATLYDLAGSDTYVTVVLAGSRARDRNLRIVNVGNDQFSVRQLNGDRFSYLFSLVHEIRVQPALIGTEGPTQEIRIRPLRPEEKEAADAAANRAREILEDRQVGTSVKMRAAAVLAARGDDEGLQALEVLTQSPDIPVAIEAALHLYVAAGKTDSELILEGLASGNRKARSTACRLAGLSGDPKFKRPLLRVLEDITNETFPDAAIAAGRLKDQSTLPLLLRGLDSLNDKKADAAAFALSDLGGTDVLAAMQRLVDSADGNIWFRAVRVLYSLGDDEAAKIMREQCLNSPAFAQEAAIILTKDRDWDAALYLRNYLSERRDPNLENLTYRARAAAALVKNGDVQANKVLRQLLSMKTKDVFKRGKVHDQAYKIETLAAVQVIVCEQLIEIGERDLVSIAGPAVISQTPEVAVAGCEAIMAIANPGYGKRLGDALK